MVVPYTYFCIEHIKLLPFRRAALLMFTYFVALQGNSTYIFCIYHCRFYTLYENLKWKLNLEFWHHQAFKALLLSAHPYWMDYFRFYEEKEKDGSRHHHHITMKVSYVHSIYWFRIYKRFLKEWKRNLYTISGFILIYIQFPLLSNIYCCIWY